jgi:hypothetical protein
MQTNEVADTVLCTPRPGILAHSVPNKPTNTLDQTTCNVTCVFTTLIETVTIPCYEKSSLNDQKVGVEAEEEGLGRRKTVPFRWRFTQQHVDVEFEAPS